MKTIFKKHDGFTLVELIVVIAILAILAAVAIPAYSGYIEKANRAGDEQLLAAVNKAFAAACTNNGSDIYLENKASAPLTAEGKVNLDKVAPYGADFKLFFAGNESAAFKVFSGIYFEKTLHQFVPVEGALGAVLSNLFANHEGDITTVKNSAFVTNMDVETLLDKVTDATDLVAALSNEGNAKIQAMILDPSNLIAMAAYMGYDVNDPEQEAAFEAEFDKMIAQKMAADGTTEDEAMNAILANNAVLLAATKSDFDRDAFVSKLTDGTASGSIIDTVLTDPQTGLSQAAMAYGMYTAYMSTTEQGVPEDVDMTVVLNTLQTDGFKSYMANSSEADVDGYFSAMNMINTASKNTEAVNDVLLNGFDGSAMSGLLQNTLG